MMGLGRELQLIYQDHISLMSENISDLASGRKPFYVPFVKKEVLQEILKQATNAFAKDPIVLSINKPTFIVGDIHGHILDLYRIFQLNGLPPEKTYLFLGDIVDRGEYGTESLILIFILKILYPKHIFLIRGNHEFASNSKANGSFYIEFCALYNHNDALFNLVLMAFAYIPLAAEVSIAGKRYICVHGGIDPNLAQISQLNTLKRPIWLASGIVEGLVWSDPDEKQTIPYIGSPRGNGYLFNKDAFDTFLRENHYDKMIRGHQFVNGYAECFDGKLITVFSASCYSSTDNNMCSYIYIDINGAICYQLLEPLLTPKRTGEKKVIENHPVNSRFSLPVSFGIKMQCLEKRTVTRLTCQNLPKLKKPL